MNNNQEDNYITIGTLIKKIWSKRKTFYIVWLVVFVFSCLWIIPQPRYYSCEVKLAPEGVEDPSGGLAGMASSLGLNVGELNTSDAIYPLLYPELFDSPDFLVSILGIEIKNTSGLKTDYYTYLKKHQKENILLKPFFLLKTNIISFFFPKDNTPAEAALNPFILTEEDHALLDKVRSRIKCNVDNKTSVITITVKDQDALASALLADSVKCRLQNFIITYRTKKIRQDVEYYQQLVDSAKKSYHLAIKEYASFMDGHRNVVLNITKQQGENYRNNLETKLALYNQANTQLHASKAKLQEKTPSFTTLKSATVPPKPSYPKRMFFVIGMLLLSTIIVSLAITRKEFTSYLLNF